MKPGPYLLGGQLGALPLLAGDDDTGCRDTGHPGETDNLPEVHEQETLQRFIEGDPSVDEAAVDDAAVDDAAVAPNGGG